MRSIIIAKCEHIYRDPSHTYVVFSCNLKELPKFVAIWGRCKIPIYGTRISDTTIEISDWHNTWIFEELSVEKWYRINMAPFNLDEVSKNFINSDLYKEETILLWQELGSLENPTIEQIDLYIEELNKRI